MNLVHPFWNVIPPLLEFTMGTRGEEQMQLIYIFQP